MPLTVEELKARFPAEYVRRAQAYQASGRVLQAQHNRRRGMVTARVAGTATRPYDVIVRLVDGDDGEREVVGQCSCREGYNCKHAAAALLELIEREPRPAAPSGRRAPKALTDWVDDLADAVGRAERGESLALRYVLDRVATGGAYGLSIAPVPPPGERDEHPVDGGAFYSAWLPSALDRWLVRVLPAAATSRQPPWLLSERPDAALLERLVATGRSHWARADTPPLGLGSPRAASPEWTGDERGRQSMSFPLGESVVVLPTDPPWYVDTGRALCGPVDTGLDDAVAGALAAAPVLEPEHTGTVREALERMGGAAPLPLARDTREAAYEPVPCLELRGPDRPRSHATDGEDDTGDRARALIWLSYGGIAVAPSAASPWITREAGLYVERLPRRSDLEDRALRRVNGAGLHILHGLDESGDVYTVDPARTSWAKVADRLLPALRGEGWRVSIADDFPFRVVAAEDWYARLDERADRDWLALELGVDIDGRRVNLVPALAQWLRAMPENLDELDALDDGEPVYVDLGRGDVARVPMARVKSIVKTLLELYRPEHLDAGGRVLLHRLNAHRADTMAEALGAPADGAEAARRLARRLREPDADKRADPPRGLQATLRGYQREGLDWLQFLRRHELGGILADDMGLGKTLQTLASVLLEKESGRADGPSLVVAPTSVLGTWRNEAERFAPALAVGLLQGPDRHRSRGELGDYDLIITSYALVTRDYDTLARQRFHYLILDEAQHIKNPKAKAARAVRGLDALHRLCLTGTPVENHLGELWAQLDFLLPGMLGDEATFNAVFRRPVERDGDIQRQTELRRRVAPVLLRRTKEDVASELPAKTEIVHPITLEGAQRDLYESVRAAMHRRVRREIDDKGIDRSHIVILDALLKLRQVCCDPRLVKLSSATKVRRSAKLDQLAELLSELIDEGRRVLVFSQFAQMLGLIEERLQGLDIDYLKLTGQTRNRQSRIDRFQNGEAPVFLISLKAGGTGLNLTAADTVIHYDPWWNPAVEAQAVDRAHRIGQDKPVFVYRLIAEGTVEERIQKLQLQKRALADALYDDSEEAAGQLSRDDLERLLEPLG